MPTNSVPKIALGFFPAKETAGEVANYISACFHGVKELLLSTYGTEYDEDATCYNPWIFLSTTMSNRHLPDFSTIDGDIVKYFWASIDGAKVDICERWFAMWAEARVKYIDRIFLNVDMKRYPVETYLKFIAIALDKYQHTALVFGQPPLFSPDSFEKKLSTEKSRHRLIVDGFINFVLSKALGKKNLVNLNAGVFSLRTQRAFDRHSEVWTTLINAKNYDESSLLCSQIIWYLSETDSFNIEACPVSNIELEQLGFSLEKAAREIKYILELTAPSGFSYNKTQICRLIDDFFNSDPIFNPYRKWLISADNDWFLDVVVPALSTLGLKI